MLNACTYISKEIDEISTLIATRISFTSNDLKNQNTKAEYIGFDRKYTLRRILWCHVTTKNKDGNCVNTKNVEHAR
jgi:hypothetical protein